MNAFLEAAGFTPKGARNIGIAGVLFAIGAAGGINFFLEQAKAISRIGRDVSVIKGALYRNPEFRREMELIEAEDAARNGGVTD